MDNNQATAQHCANCAKPALHLCPRCADGLNIHGQERKVYYDGKDCQTAHWAAGHEVECKVARDRRQLHRVSSLLQWAFYGTREAAWYDEVKAVEREDGEDPTKLLVRLGKNDNSARFSTFPSKLFPQVHEKRAALVHGAAQSSVVGMGEGLISLLEGMHAAHLRSEMCTDRFFSRHQARSSRRKSGLPLQRFAPRAFHLNRVLSRCRRDLHGLPCNPKRWVGICGRFLQRTVSHDHFSRTRTRNFPVGWLPRTPVCFERQHREHRAGTIACFRRTSTCHPTRKDP